MMKFTQHDRVKYNGKKGRVVTGWVSVTGKPKYRISLDDGTSLEVVEEKLELDDSDPWGIAKYNINPHNDPERCPKCYNKWKETKFGNNVWYDCVTCKKTKEEIMKSKSKEKEVEIDLEKDIWSMYSDGFLD
jgi:hypothetical protein